MEFATPQEFIDFLQNQPEERKISALLTADDLESMTREDALAYALGSIAAAHNAMARGKRAEVTIRQTQAELWLAIAKQMPRSPSLPHQ